MRLCEKCLLFLYQINVQWFLQQSQNTIEMKSVANKNGNDTECIQIRCIQTFCYLFKLNLELHVMHIKWSTQNQNGVWNRIEGWLI